MSQQNLSPATLTNSYMQNLHNLLAKLFSPHLSKVSYRLVNFPSSFRFVILAPNPENERVHKFTHSNISKGKISHVTKHLKMLTGFYAWYSYLNFILLSTCILNVSKERDASGLYNMPFSKQE